MPRHPRARPANLRPMRSIFPQLQPLFVIVALLPARPACPASSTGAPRTSSTNTPAWLNQPPSVTEALNVDLQQNSAILKGKSDLEATYGVIVQTKAIAIPKLRA